MRETIGKKRSRLTSREEEAKSMSESGSDVGKRRRGANRPGNREATSRSESTRESTRESISESTRESRSGVEKRIEKGSREGESTSESRSESRSDVGKRCREAMSRSDADDAKKRCREEAMPRRSDAAHLLCPYLRKKEMKIYQNLSKKQYVRALEGTKKRLEFFFYAIFFSQVPQKETSCRSEISFLLRVLSKESKRRW